MTSAAPDPPREPSPDHHSTAPRPTTLLAALIIGGVLVYHLRLDVMSDSYSGAKVSYALVFGLLFVLGVDLSRFWPGGRDK